MSESDWNTAPAADAPDWKARAEAAERELADIRAALEELRTRLGSLVNAAARAARPTEHVFRSGLQGVRDGKGGLLCPAGHGLMRYSIEDDHLHCQHADCGAVATTHGNIIVDQDPVETKKA